MAVEVMRRDVDLEGVGGAGDLHRLPYAVPGRVDDGDIHRLFAEIGQEFAQAQQGLAGRNRVRTLPPDIAECFRVEAVDLDPEHVEIGDDTQDLQIPLGLGIEIEIEQNIDIGPGAITDGLQMHAQVAQYLAVDVDLRLEWRAEAGSPASRLAVCVSEDVGLQGGKLLLAHLAPDRLDAVEIGNGRLEPVGMVDAPSGAMRPVDPN